MIINLPRCLEFDLNQQIGAQLSWEAARVTCQIPLYTFFVPLYSLWQYSYQFCSRWKKVLRSVDMLVASLGVTSSWGSNCQAVIDAKRVDTVQGCDYYFTYNTIISLITYIIAIIAKKRICNLAWHSLEKRGQKHAAATLREIRVSSKQKHNRLSLEAPTCPAPLAGRQQG